MAQIRFIRLGGPLSPWGRFAVFLVLLFVFGLAIAIAILALGLFIVAVPVLLAASLAYSLLRKFLPRPPQRKPSAGADIIEGEFRVVDPDAPAISAGPRNAPERSR